MTIKKIVTGNLSSPVLSSNDFFFKKEPSLFTWDGVDGFKIYECFFNSDTELQICCVFAFFTLWKRVKTHVLSDQSVHLRIHIAFKYLSSNDRNIRNNWYFLKENRESHNINIHVSRNVMPKAKKSGYGDNPPTFIAECTFTHTYCCVSKLSKFGVYLYAVDDNTSCT
jgi:hypothetical protein